MEARDSRLAGKQILVVEDEYFLANDLKRALESGGARVIGPFGGLGPALSAVETIAPLDGAILDINLGGSGDVYPVAEALRGRNLPFVFATGYDHMDVRPDFADVPHLCKPLNMDEVSRALFPD